MLYINPKTTSFCPDWLHNPRVDFCFLSEIYLNPKTTSCRLDWLINPRVELFSSKVLPQPQDDLLLPGLAPQPQGRLLLLVRALPQP
jgi:hypothetical protein